MGQINQVFQRYELKYILKPEDYSFIRTELLKHMRVDEYGMTTIQSVYYDTPDSILIRKSIDNPGFKEKIRMRSYGLASENSQCFIELKRKAEGLVYKRRIPVTEEIACDFMSHKGNVEDTQIARELTYFRDYYKDLKPAILIIYERESFTKDGSEVRVTFDYNPRYRTTDVNLHTSLDGEPLLDEDYVLMEIKVLHNMPLWLTDILTRGHIKKGSMSKYGKAYQLEREKILSCQKGGN